MSEYDPATGRWEEKAAIPTKRAVLAVSVVNNKIYAIGGWGNWGVGQLFSTIEEYDPVTDTWTKKTDMQSAASDVSSGVVDGKIYVIGGWLGGLNIREWVEKYTPEGWPFPSAVSPQGKLVKTWGGVKTFR